MEKTKEEHLAINVVKLFSFNVESMVIIVDLIIGNNPVNSAQVFMGYVFKSCLNDASNEVKPLSDFQNVTPDFNLGISALQIPQTAYGPVILNYKMVQILSR